MIVCAVWLCLPSNGVVSRLLRCFDSSQDVNTFAVTAASVRIILTLSRQQENLPILQDPVLGLQAHCHTLLANNHNQQGGSSNHPDSRTHKDMIESALREILSHF